MEENSSQKASSTVILAETFRHVYRGYASGSILPANLRNALALRRSRRTGAVGESSVTSRTLF